MAPGSELTSRKWLGAFGRILLFTGLVIVFSGAGMIVAGNLATGQDSFVLPFLVVAMAAVAAGALLIRWLDRRPAGALGIGWTSRTVWEIGVGLAIGAGALVFAVALMVLVGGLRYTAQPGDVIGWLTTVATGFGGLAIPAFAEEALFRGYAFQVLVQALGGPIATLLASPLFAAAHAQNPNVDAFALVNIFLAGVLLSVAYLRTRSLWFATAVHLGWNWAMALPFDLPVSGQMLYDTPLYEPVLAGPRWLTGGEFGPEAGVVGTLAFGVALAAVLSTPGVKVAPEMRSLRPLGLAEAEHDAVRRASGARDAREADG